MANTSDTPSTRRVLHLVTGSVSYELLTLIADHTDRTRFDVAFATLEGSGEFHDDIAARGLDAVALGATGRSSYPAAVLRLAGLLRRRRIDVLQTHLFEAQLVGLLAGRLARTPLMVMTAHHSHELPLLGRRVPFALDRLSATRLAHRIIAPSASMATTLERDHGVPPGRIAVVLHGFDVAGWEPSESNRARIRADLDLDDRVVITSVARFHWIKDHPGLLRAFAAVGPAHADAVLVLVGGGDDRAARALAAELDIVDRVRFTGPRHDVGAILDASDVFVHAALSESFGLVLGEAMAKAKPIVTTRVGAVPELLGDGDGGAVVEPGDPIALGGALSDVLGRRHEWSKMGWRNHERIAGHRAETMVSSYEELYVRWLDRSDQRPTT